MPSRKTWQNWAVVGLSVAVSQGFWSSPALYPFRLLVTLFHEFGHALATYLVFGHVARIEIDAIGAGVTHSYGWHFGALGAFVISSGGYMGSACFGALILYLGGKPRIQPYLLPILVAWLGLISVLYWGGLFTFLTCVVMAAGLFAIHRYLPAWVCHVLVTFIGVYTALYALHDTLALITHRGPYHFAGGVGRTDAEALQDLTVIPAAFWAALWLGISMLVVWLAAKKRLQASEATGSAPEP